MKVRDLLIKKLNNERMPRRIKVPNYVRVLEGMYNEEYEDYRLGRYNLRYKDIYLFEYIFTLGDNLAEMGNRKHILDYDVIVEEE